VSFAACAALAGIGAAQAATVVAGASANVITQVVAEPTIVLSLSGGSSANSVIVSATNISARADASGLSAATADSGGTLSMMATDTRAPGKSGDSPASGMAAISTASSGGNVNGAGRKLSIEVSQSDLAALGALSITLNYN
jgi:hypothetical protein